MNLRLNDQVVFVAGASRGIGKAIAGALLEEGARVVLTGRDPASLQAAVACFNTHSERILAIPGDLTRPASIAASLQQATEHFGRVDHLVANLGSGSGKPGWQQDDAEWDRLFEVNFFAATRLAQAVLPQLLANPLRGSILFIASIVALEATHAPLPYSAAKAALINYAKNLARQLGRQGIRVNIIAPGNIVFPGGSWERHQLHHPETVQAMLSKEVPLGRFGTPQEVAALAAYLCSSLAAFTTGACFVVDGGQTRTL